MLGGVPAWAEGIAEGDLCAPDVAYFNGRYHLHCSASTFGSSRSAIGLATSPTLSPDSASYDWTDQEKRTESVDSDPYKAIDPNIITDREDRIWMAFGGYDDEGVHLRRISPETGMLSSQDETFYNIADRPDANPSAIEAPYIVGRDGYYLFGSWRSCCPEPNEDSDYNIRAGRSDSITGPYVDQDDTPTTEGGGPLVPESVASGREPGTTRYCRPTTRRCLSTTRTTRTRATLRTSPIEWQNGRPTVPKTEQQLEGDARRAL